jgi:hypothetical protein
MIEIVIQFILLPPDFARSIGATDVLGELLAVGDPPAATSNVEPYTDHAAVS